MTGRTRRVLRIGSTVVLVLVVSIVTWTLVAIRARPEARAALTGDAAVTVVQSDTGVTFTPLSRRSATGLLFFAGALVDPISYAPILRTAAAAGHAAVLVKLPGRGLFGGLEGDDVLARTASAIEAVEGVDRWVVAAHSRGGGPAARLVTTDERRYVALVLLGSSDPRDFSLAGTPAVVTQIYGTHDTVETPDRIARSLTNLPPTTRRVRIEGGNHSQFGYYGLQPGDWPAAITRDEQQRAVLEVLLGILAGTATSRIR